MAEVIAVVSAIVIWAGGGTAVVSASTIAIAAIQVAAVAGSLAYQRRTAKKAKAAAEKLKKEQARRQAALRAQLSKFGKESEGFGGGVARDLTSMIRRSTVSRRITYGRARLGGVWAYVETTGASNEYLHLILALCEGPVSGIEKVYFDDEEVTFDPVTGNGTGKWKNYLIVKPHLGALDQEADATLNGVSSKWTDAHRLSGIAYLYVRLRVNLSLYPAIPEISAVVRGKGDILDPRTGERGYTTNAALCLADYLATPLVGPGIAREDIDHDSLCHAADVCDEVVETLSGTEARYTVSGVIDLSNTVEDNAGLFVQAMNGDLIHSGGRFEIQAGEYRTPTFTIDADMLAGPIEFSSLQPRRDRSNVVKGTFLSEQNQWQRFDFPSVTDADAVEQDGQEVVTDLSLELVGSGSQAQRLASMELRQARRGRTFNLICNLKAMPVRVGSNVILDMPRYGSDRVYRVVEYRFSVGNDGALGVALTLLENHEDIYQWSRAREKQINVPAELSAGRPQVAQPVFSTPGGDIAGSASITITTLTTGATLRWSKTAEPETETDGSAYSGAVSVSEGDTLWARGFKSDLLPSPVTVAVYE